MNNIYRIISAICLVFLINVDGAHGSYMSDLINLTDPAEEMEEDTPIERAIEAGECDYCNMENKISPAGLSQTPVPIIPEPVSVSTPKPSPGAGILMFISVMLSIYFLKRG
ncbi:MAG: hypothetical protein OIN87_13805 [Candidatus Methanoperedens sp.]|nr:hypothetical protein [Candidatus Methanoperedens sp.]